MTLLDKIRKIGSKKQTKPAQKTGGRKIVEKTVSQKGKEPVRPIKPKGLQKNTGWVYQIIQEPHITEKAGFLNEKSQYVFRIFPKANKTEIKKAVKALYGVKAKKIRIVSVAPKKRRLGRHQGWRDGLKHGYKKAIVVLEQGEKIEIQ